MCEHHIHYRAIPALSRHPNQDFRISTAGKPSSPTPSPEFGIREKGPIREIREEIF
jgi:hypothetical protein